MTEIEQVDAIVIGGSTRGMVAAYVLNELGYKSVLFERASDLGGGDGSFRASDGTWFDFGMHVLDELRTELATRLFTHAVDQRVHRTKLRRAIVLRNHIMPYSPDPTEMPAELRDMLISEELVDEIGDAKPTRGRLSQVYGSTFANLILDEVLPSYPSEHRHLSFGVDEAELLANIYPWFFPRARRTPKQGDISRNFHDKLRRGVDQFVLYPVEGGFAEFSRGLARKLSGDRSEIIMGAKDVDIVLTPETQRIDYVASKGRRFQAKYYFWASGWPELCKLLDIPCQNAASDRIVLGSFRLNRSANTPYHEILVGDPQHLINRIQFPAAFRGTDEALMQIEFAFPLAEDRPSEQTYWLESWVRSAKQLEILDDGHRIEVFDFKTRPIHFNSYGVEGQKLRDADPTLINESSNIHPVVPSMSNLNLNAHIPLDVAYVTNVLAKSG